MLVARGFTDIHDVDDRIRHFCFIGHSISSRQFLLDQIKGTLTAFVLSGCIIISPSLFLYLTFLIAAFVLAPEGGIAYYFFNDVAPINHFIGPLLSVISLLFLERTEKLPIRIIIWPALASLMYGVTVLLLNALRIMDGSYFFLKVYELSAGVIAAWFAIIAALCLGLAFLYYKVKFKHIG